MINAVKIKRIPPPVARVWTRSLSLLLLAPCALVLLLVAGSHRLQTPEQIHARLLQDSLGLDSAVLRRWLTPNATFHEPEFVLS